MARQAHQSQLPRLPRLAALPVAGALGLLGPRFVPLGWARGGLGVPRCLCSLVLPGIRLAIVAHFGIVSPSRLGGVSTPLGRARHGSDRHPLSCVRGLRLFPRSVVASPPVSSRDPARPLSPCYREPARLSTREAPAARGRPARGPRGACSRPAAVAVPSWPPRGARFKIATVSL